MVREAFTKLQTAGLGYQQDIIPDHSFEFIRPDSTEKTQHKKGQELGFMSPGVVEHLDPTSFGSVATADLSLWANSSLLMGLMDK
jgi:hypothetical protein